MSESILKALMRLFAIIANFDKDDESSSGKKIVGDYLKQQLNQELVDEYLGLFEEYMAVHHSKKGKKRMSANSVKVLMICEQINEELRQEQKVLVLLQLLEFINFGGHITDNEVEFVKTVADTFNISQQEYEDCKALILDKYDKIPNKSNVLIIDNNEFFDEGDIKHIYSENINGQIIMLHIQSTNMYAFGYVGEDELYLNGHIISPKRAYILVKGSSIRSRKINPIYYSDIVGKFLESTVKTKISFIAEEIEFKFKNSTNGIQKFNFVEESGQLIGVMGGSGAGKSTLLNVLNGNLKIKSGQIRINGYDLYDDKDELEGIIGFVPQDDLLIEELTVYQNLYYNAKLCFADYTKEQLDEAASKVLQDLELYEIRNLKVGGPLNKFISGGQRKRLNIALELIREPSVMFVDEPTSGLSSNDSEMVMDLLKEQALKGRLVIINIHQPSSDIYKLFDKLLIMDKGGHAVYYGNPVDAIVYFKKMTNHVNADESECLCCGNVNPEQVLQILEAKVVDEYGKLTRNRKISSKEWYSLYRENLDKKPESIPEKGDIPESHFKIPGKFKQFRIFTVRDVLSKLTNKQYLLLNFLEAPLLAVILGYFTKYIAGDEYIFSENENLPAYMFMAVVVALFLGMTVSAEEIIKDKKILQRESFLNLSRFSYINSKVLIMFVISAIQSLSFVLLGNLILGIEGLTITYWMVLFSTACFANMLGLNISSALNSVVTIYILIPFILVPQLLLSGVIVKFDKLHKNVSSFVYVPFVGDMMTSRWAYEALAVAQFKNNKYEKHFFDVEQKMSEYGYISGMWLPEIKSKINNVEKNFDNPEKAEENEKDLLLIRNELKRLAGRKDLNGFCCTDEFTMDKFNSKLAKKANNYLDELRSIFSKKTNEYRSKKDEITTSLIDNMEGGKDEYVELMNNNLNYNLRDLLRNRQELNKILEADNRLIQLTDPIFKMPESNFGRAHFYSPVKIIGNTKIDTTWFNVMVIWLTTIIMYFVLVFDGLRKLLESSWTNKLANMFKKKE
ncbi:MAG: ABC transporter [Marinilabiliales bacterium]|nr:MAG: ABC transporter [Marinilabiliales bacterium]